uniref:Uncharacterized protein n=1 Tax=Cajanus cajan TaxID=3821 RepID=A0A151T3Y8_CAJCA|nr:hypothetical protein KK1_016276 [Cajanus cajan]
MNKLQHDNTTSNVGDFSKDHLNTLEERLRVVEGHNFDVQEAANMCLVQDIQFPAKFKIPNFQKYTRASCPKGHLTMYCKKMAAYMDNEKLLIHCFQESLSDVALNWYMQLDGGKIQTWKQLVNAFLRRYKYNIDLIPDRSDLQSLSKKGDESFKIYAQRWRELAAQIEPILSDKEMVTMFINSLSGPHYDKMIGNTLTGMTLEYKMEKLLESNPGFLHSFDPEIDRTFHRLIREHIIPSLDSNSHSDSHSVSVASELDSIQTENMGEQPYSRPRERTLREMAAPDFTYESLCIQYSEEDVPCVLKIGLIHLLPKFHGYAGEDPNKHLKEFHIVCSTMKPPNVQEDHIYLKAFPHSLDGVAKDWIYYLAPGPSPARMILK